VLWAADSSSGADGGARVRLALGAHAPAVAGGRVALRAGVGTVRLALGHIVVSPGGEQETTESGDPLLVAFGRRAGSCSVRMWTLQSFGLRLLVRACILISECMVRG
jgi:hypothetical protein